MSRNKASVVLTCLVALQVVGAGALGGTTEGEASAGSVLLRATKTLGRDGSGGAPGGSGGSPGTRSMSDLRYRTAPGCSRDSLQGQLRCLYPEFYWAKGSGRPSVPAVSAQTYTISDVQRLPLPPGRMVVEPPGGYVLAEVPVNVYAVDAGSSDVPTVVLGVPVVVRVTPVSWSWAFGDGGSVGPTSDPGGAYPSLTNTHAYAGVGSYSIVMTTFYRAELSVAGGAFEPIEGQASVASAPVTVQVLASSVESIPGEVRAEWIRAEHPEVRVVSALDDAPIDYADPAVREWFCRRVVVLEAPEMPARSKLRTLLEGEA